MGKDKPYLEGGKGMYITGEIDQVGGGKLTAPEDAAIYLINFNGHAALVDAGCGRALPRRRRPSSPTSSRTCGRWSPTGGYAR